jgi:hypothetical protein
MRAPLSLSVVWSESGGRVVAGRLDVDGAGLALAGGSRREPVALEIPFAGLAAVRLGRRPEERLGGRATLVLALRDGRVVSIAGVATVGTLHELAERLQSAIA